jgi:hypothetical protein
MKSPCSRSLSFSAAILGLALMPLSVQAQRAASVDPPQVLNLYTSLGEWNSAADPVGWTGVNITGLTVGQGWLSGTTVGNDPQLVRNGLTLDSTTGNFPVIEIRARKEAGETSRVDLFWADGAGGFAGARRATVNVGLWPADGQFHIFQVSLGDLFTGTITGLRFDPVSDVAASKAIAVDYIRIGRIAPDRDMDGLADEVETNTRNYVSPSNTGSDPDDFDTDDDTFSDGVEVFFGTDPNNAASFPTPTFTGYSVAPAVYVRNVAIAGNAPVIANGTPTGFTVSPALPAGLMLNPSSGVITGTPTVLAASAVYTVTANFSGGLSGDFALTLEVRDPGFVRYGVNPASYNVNAPIAANNPVLVGPAPDSFAVSPALPDGLFLDPASGAITGTPNVVTPTASYTVTASYTGYPSASATVSIRIKAVPVFLGVDNTPLGMSTSLGEWEAGLDGWGFTNGNGAANGGILTVTTTALDPQMTRGALGYDPANGTILELRFRQSDTALIEIFWGDASGGGAAAVRRTEIPSSVILGDGQFHTYQVSFADVFEGNLTLLRVDPGVVAGRTVDFDYIRIGTVGLPQPIAITGFSYDALFREVTLTWTSSSGSTYRIEATDSFLSPWSVVATGLAGDPGTTNYIDDSLPADATQRYYRVRRE